ncbi:GerMN domain-containing protein [Caldalkalibacillus salinus]|uniref:GerMN domain-containing protein n=1 Tax=Caldalkalibacillus salinus TaxID=2803787 RepID=UPI00192455C3|nr:GerMN domain-containing protein [Caldalkalibacillus salinus]
MFTRKGFLSIFSLLVVIVFTTGCVFGPSDDAGSEIDPPQIDYGEEEDSTDIVFEIDESDENPETDENVSATSTDEPSSTTERTLYLFDENGYVVSVSLPLPQTEGVATQALRYLVEGGPVTNVLPSGMRAVIPAGTELSVNVKEDGTAVVDFSPEFRDYQAEDEKGILEAITWTLTEFDSIEQVQISINGHLQETMPVDGTPVGSPLSRKDGINIEVANEAQIGNNSTVTLYFMAQNESATVDYFVPVTRIVPKTDDLVQATVNELVAGPQQGSGLVTGVVDTKLLDQQLDGDVLTLNFDETFLQYAEEEPKASDDAIKSLVLSLTEHESIDKVQFMVDGSEQLVTYSGADLSQPVSRSFVGQSTGF